MLASVALQSSCESGVVESLIKLASAKEIFLCNRKIELSESAIAALAVRIHEANVVQKAISQLSPLSYGDFAQKFTINVVFAPALQKILNFHGLRAEFLQEYAEFLPMLRMQSVLVLAAAAQSAIESERKNTKSPKRSFKYGNLEPNVYEVTALREQLTFFCDEYKEFDDLHRKILVPAVRQIEEICKVRVNVEFVQKSRNKVTKLRLRMEKATDTECRK